MHSSKQTPSLGPHRKRSEDLGRLEFEFEIVLSPGAKAILGDIEQVRTSLNQALRTAGRDLPEEIVLWRDTGEHVSALLNRNVMTAYIEHFGGTDADLTRERAIRNVALGIGAGQDLPSGKEYVRRVRGIWKGLLPRERP